MRYFSLALICIFFMASQSQAKTYEGTIGTYPVGMNIALTNAGKIEGTYFYQKSGVNIALTGVKQGSSITLTEHDPRGKKTGTFLCTEDGLEISGKWTSADGKKELPVVLTEISADKLQKIQQAAQLDAFDRKLLPAKDKCYEANLTYTFKNEFIRSLIINIDHLCGPYPSSETTRKTYNTQTKKDIDLWNELDPARIEDFKTYLNQETQKKFDNWRAQTSDKEWEEIFSTFSCGQYPKNAEQDNPQEWEEIFVVKDATRIMTEFYVDKDGVHIGRCNYCEFPHVIQALDFCGDIILTPSILDKYLKEDSILRKIQAP